MWTGILLLLTITVIYAGYNRLVKVSSNYVPEPATSTVLATICLQRAALAASGTVALLLLARSGHVLKLSATAYAWAAGAGLCIGLAEIGYFYLFRGVGGTGPVTASVAVTGDLGHRYRDGLPRRIPVLNAAESAEPAADAVTP